ncbi:MAG TPA: hypothetical protein PKV27_08025, partial [Ilumatobacteraceae bacterium]|nr:hypothetical protein [Ilumatobacteraceae bacterium]
DRSPAAHTLSGCNDGRVLRPHRRSAVTNIDQLQRLVDQAEIQRQLVRFARAMDDRGGTGQKDPAATDEQATEAR